MSTETITINDQEHNVEDLTAEQQYVVTQLQDLTSKQSNLQFQLDQLLAAKQVFLNTLAQSLESQEEEATE